ncbi:MAG: hypothetical protein ACLUVV_08155 [Christensenellales bacterium]
MSSTERLAGQGSEHSPKPRAAVVYGPSPGYFFLQCRAYGPDKEAGTAQRQRDADVYGLSPGHYPLQCRAYGPDKEAGTARPYTAPGLLR